MSLRYIHTYTYIYLHLNILYKYIYNINMMGDLLPHIIKLSLSN